MKKSERNKFRKKKEKEKEKEKYGKNRYQSRKSLLLITVELTCI